MATCETCGKSGLTGIRAALSRCETCCNRCDQCKRGRDVVDLCHYMEGVFCDDCRFEQVRARVASYNSSTNSEELPTCPYCGEQDGEWWDRWGSASTFTTTCDFCEGEYECEIENNPTFTTSKVSAPPATAGENGGAS